MWLPSGLLSIADYGARRWVLTARGTGGHGASFQLPLCTGKGTWLQAAASGVCHVFGKAHRCPHSCQGLDTNAGHQSWRGPAHSELSYHAGHSGRGTSILCSHVTREQCLLCCWKPFLGYPYLQGRTQRTRLVPCIPSFPNALWKTSGLLPASVPL